MAVGHRKRVTGGVSDADSHPYRPPGGGPRREGAAGTASPGRPRMVLGWNYGVTAASAGASSPCVGRWPLSSLVAFSWSKRAKRRVSRSSGRSGLTLASWARVSRKRAEPRGPCVRVESQDRAARREGAAGGKRQLSPDVDLPQRPECPANRRRQRPLFQRVR